MDKQAYEHLVGMVITKEAAPRRSVLGEAGAWVGAWAGRNLRKLKHAFNPQYGQRLRDINATRAFRSQANKEISATLDRVIKAPRHLGAHEPHVQRAANNLAASLELGVRNPGKSGIPIEDLRRINADKARRLGDEIAIIRNGDPNLPKAQKVITNTPQVPQVRLNQSAIHPAGGNQFNLTGPRGGRLPDDFGSFARTTPTTYLELLLGNLYRADMTRRKAQFDLNSLRNAPSSTLKSIQEAEENAHLWRP